MERTTEKTLNSKTWVDSYGTIIAVNSMDSDHLRNVLKYLYKQRGNYWLNCRDVKVIEAYRDGDEFFKKVIRHSTLWTELVSALRDNPERFNFDYESGDEDWTH